MTVKEIIVKYLKENGYDGLYHLNCNGGCTVEDLFPCGEISRDCEPGYFCSEDSWHISPKRRSDET